MATLTIRHVKEDTKTALQHRAVRHGVSMEQELRTILDEVAAADTVDSSGKRHESLYRAIRRLVEPYGGFELAIPPRENPRDPPVFS